ncbi:MAG: DNA alkylation repair protein [Actinobacteria bacterium]|nr:MAG: DNA alkylation repair protein [Actinomycetota bacterium]
MQLNEVLAKLKSLSNPKNVEGMARFGINPDKTFGIQIPVLRQMAKEIEKDPDFAKAPTDKHSLALELWDSGYHEARILATMIDDYKQVDEGQMDTWVANFDSWDVCDQCIMNLFEDADMAWDKAVEWSAKDEEFVKRAGFVVMARLAVSDKKAEDEKFNKFFPIIKQEAHDERNFVKKAVNWALRQIGKRNINLNKRAIRVGEEIEKQDSKAAKWIAKDALRELQSEPVQRRLKK